MFTTVLFMAAKRETSVFGNKGMVNSAFPRVCSVILMGMTGGKKKKEEVVTFMVNNFKETSS